VGNRRRRAWRERQPTKENIGQATAPRTQSRIGELSDLLGVRKAARKDKRTRFTALLHHVTVGLLRDSYYALKRDAAPGVDGVRWKEYETDLDEKLADLHGRIHREWWRDHILISDQQYARYFKTTRDSLLENSGQR
jgi:hypothetical protein